MAEIDGKELSGIKYLEWLKDNFPADNTPLLGVPPDPDPDRKIKPHALSIVFGSVDFYGPKACICGAGIASGGHKSWCTALTKQGNKDAFSDQQSR